MKSLRWRVTRTAFAFSVLAGLLATLYMIKAEALVWHVWHQLHATDHHGLDLTQYQVSVEAKPLSGYKNLSGITFNRETGTLFAVLNDMGKIIELTTDGVPLREISVQGVDDLEGITHIEQDYFALADERQSQLLLLQIGPKTKEVSINDAKLFRLGLNERGNKNFEGVSWDSFHHRLIVVKERDPKYVISVSGLYHPEQTQLNKVLVERMPQYDQAIKWVLRDLSEVSYHAKSGHLFLLSDESKLLKQFDESGQAMGSLALWQGFHGLRKSIPQPEGVTLDDAGNIYIVSEPNLFYVFKPQSRRPV